MKKVLALVLTVALSVACALTLVACNGKTGRDSAGNDSGNTPANTNVKVALITLHDENSTYDKNFIDAFKAACAAKGLTEDNYSISSGIDEGPACYNKAAEYADAGYTAIFADSFGHESHMLRAAQEFPEVQFYHATGTQAHTANQANYHNAFASIYEGRYLAGVAAGLKLKEMYENGDLTSKDFKVGYVGAFPYAEVISGYTSWYLGVKSVVDEMEGATLSMEVRYTNSWYNETDERTTATALIKAGCVLISQHADSMGAPSACETENVPNVSYNGSTEVNCPNTFIVSSKINWQPYFEMMIDAAMGGKAVPTDWTGTMDTESVQLTALGKLAPAAGTEEKLAEVKAKLANKEIRVFDCSKFTVGGEHLTSYKADVDDEGDWVKETEVIMTDGNGITYFAESEYRSAPYFDIIIDGINA